MTEPAPPTAAQRAIGDFAPKLVSLTNEIIIHLAFYAGWPRAMSAISMAKQVFEGEARR